MARIRCEYFVNASNNYLSRNIGKCSVTKVRVPTLACQHQILETQPFDITGTNQSLPIINDFDNRFTVYQRDDSSLCLTGYEKVSHLVRKCMFSILKLSWKFSDTGCDFLHLSICFPGNVSLC